MPKNDNSAYVCTCPPNTVGANCDQTCNSNLILNTGFESSNTTTNFTNGYGFVPSRGTSGSALTPPCLCTIVDKLTYPASTTKTYHPSWAACSPRSGKRALACNGCTNTATNFQYAIVWATAYPIAVAGGATYNGSFFGASLYTAASVFLQMQYCEGTAANCPLLNNTAGWITAGPMIPVINATTIPANQQCVYYPGAASFTVSGGATQIWIRLLDLSGASSGNDFILDDILLARVCTLNTF